MVTQNKFTIYFEQGDKDTQEVLFRTLQKTDGIKGFTCYLNCIGYDGQCADKVYVIEIITVEDIYTELVGFCEIIKTLVPTNSVLLTCEQVEAELI